MSSWNSYHAGTMRFVRKGEDMIAKVTGGYAGGKAPEDGFVIPLNGGIDLVYVPKREFLAAQKIAAAR